jgi:hypothetical protein
MTGYVNKIGDKHEILYNLHAAPWHVSSAMWYRSLRYGKRHTNVG